ncbi:MAG: bifunctional DNA primase/polymerase, partial [Planctomycetota bacterium]
MCYPDRAGNQWFSKNNRNIAVVLGPVSGDLVCRDFDSMAEYERWKQGYPELAKTLPTDRTADGMHVYFQARVEGIMHVDNGELRGSRCYCLLPPSVHPDGPTY